MEQPDNESPVVIDAGSGFCKFGFAEKEAVPQSFPTLVGRPRHAGIVNLTKSIYVGSEALAKRGIVNDWDSMESVWQHIFETELRSNSASHAVVLTESPFASQVDREKTTQIMFETFQTPSLFISIPAVLSLHALGRKNGVVVDLGYDTCFSVPVKNGRAVTSAISSLDFGGRELTDYFVDIITDMGYAFKTKSGDTSIANDIKEKLTYVARDFNSEMEVPVSAGTMDATYELPDGQIITINNIRFRCPEALFQPSFLGKEESPYLHEMVENSITKCPNECRKDMYAQVVLAGGSSLFPGLAERLRKELSNLIPCGYPIKILAPQGRQYSAWQGGSLLSLSPEFPSLSVSKAEFDEIGVSVIHTKCS